MLTRTKIKKTQREHNYKQTVKQTNRSTLIFQNYSQKKRKKRFKVQIESNTNENPKIMLESQSSQNRAETQRQKENPKIDKKSQSFFIETRGCIFLVWIFDHPCPNGVFA